MRVVYCIEIIIARFYLLRGTSTFFFQESNMMYVKRVSIIPELFYEAGMQRKRV
jgi:hypothetical protein